MEQLGVLREGRNGSGEIRADGTKGLQTERSVACHGRFCVTLRFAFAESKRSCILTLCLVPETGRARWAEILDAEKLKQCV
jgi:hypothetical protein